MNVRIGNIEVTDVSIEELDALVKRYGEVAQSQPFPIAHANGQRKPAAHILGTHDHALLKRFLETQAGVTAPDITMLLGKRGKALPKALQDWSNRIGLTADNNVTAWEFVRLGTKRAYRLRQQLVEVARSLCHKPGTGADL